MPSFQDSLESRFPNAMDETSFVRWSHQAIARHGFGTDNTIACVGVCRDELCRSLVWAVRDDWGEAFNFSSLGGLLTLGTSGFTAAHYHAPIVDGRERYLYIVMPHIGISKDGEFGKCLRAGRHGSTAACGALTAVRDEIKSGGLDLSVDHNNIEYSMLKQRLAPRLSGEVPDMASLTLTMSELISDELERMIELTVDVEQADYAVLTGVQIHAPIKGSMIWVNKRYACVQGTRHQLEF
jgi:hypothetical protein